MENPNNDQIQAVILSQDTMDAIKEINQLVNDETLGIEISSLNFYCQKTGAIIGGRDEKSLFSLMKIHGKEIFTQSLYWAPSLNVHPAWIETNGEKLDILIDADPIGYACYCFNLITNQFYQSTRNQDAKRLPAIEKYWAMARAHALLQYRGISNLAELNVELCKFLTFAPDSKSYLFKQVKEMARAPDMLALLHCTGDLIPKLHQAINSTLNAIGNFHNEQRLMKKGLTDEIYRTPSDAARGPSNIRKQKSATRSILEAELFSSLTKLFDDPDTIRPVAGTSKWRERWLKTSDVKQDELLADFAALGNLNLDEFESPNEPVENEVEVRTLSREIEEKIIEQPTIIEVLQEQKKPLTIRERLALIKKGS